jgi:hypothetical protein
VGGVSRIERLGVWGNSTNPNNVMKTSRTNGSKLTVSNPRNPSQHWSYVTLFEASIGRFRAREGADAVEIINPKRACEGPPRTTLERG